MQRPDKNLRVFIGPAEIANVGVLLAGGLRERGIRVTAVTRELLPLRAGMKYDVVLDFRGSNRWHWGFKTLYYYFKFFLQHNAFIFLYGVSLLPRNLDLPILKLFHKKTIMWFLGSDIRHYESVEAAIKKMGIKYRQSEALRISPERLKQKKKMIHRVEKYVNYIVTGPSIAQLLTRRYYRIPIPLDTSNIRYNSMPNPKPVVVHAPTSDEKKGTSYLLEAVEKLKNEGYEFEFHLFRNMSNIKVREALSAADIAVDQLFAPSPGMFALESMAAGCAVLGGNIPQFAGFPQELPIIHTDPDNIYQNLKRLLENPKLRQELGKKGREYVEKYHDSRKIADDILQLLSGKTENLISYEPPEQP